MCACWTADPRMRLDFAAIRQQLALQLETVSDEYSYLKLDASKDYYNVSYGELKEQGGEEEVEEGENDEIVEEDNIEEIKNEENIGNEENREVREEVKSRRRKKSEEDEERRNGRINSEHETRKN
uniref:Pkinase_Tyr domain-containing protein n=1 Tax=Meloidogyne hapla TaxID=6305 RepID=A0A1I8BEL1_MELHA